MPNNNPPKPSLNYAVNQVARDNQALCARNRDLCRKEAEAQQKLRESERLLDAYRRRHQKDLLWIESLLAENAKLERLKHPVPSLN